MGSGLDPKAGQEPGAADRTDPPGQMMTARPFRFWIKPAVLILLVSGIAAMVWTTGIRDWIDPNRMILLLKDLGSMAPVVYILIMAGTVVISPIPSLPLDAAAGAVFGPFLGTVYSVLGAEAGALISFFIGRALGRETIARLLKADIAFCDLCAERQLIYAIFIARLLPFFSFDIISYGAGLTRISVRGFALATLLGMILPTFVVNYFGSNIFSGSALTFVLAGLMVLFFFLVPIWIKRKNPWGLYDRMSSGHRKNQDPR